MEKFESKLLPILRQGIAVIQMVFFKKLKDHLSSRYPDRGRSHMNMLTGAIVNDIFGASNSEEPFTLFVEEYSDLIEEELHKVPFDLVDMMVPLTDALRIQVLCDGQEGIDSSSLLIRANELKILLIPREIPLPAAFISMARELGSQYDIVQPPQISGMNKLN